MEETVEITPDKKTMKVGYKISILSKSVTQTKTTKACFNINETDCPENYIRASGTATFSPPISMRKFARTQIPTWFIAKENVEVDVCVYTKLSNLKWNEGDVASLTDEGFVDTQLKELNNFTVFLNKKSLPDVKISVKAYLFYNENGSFKTVFGLNDVLLEKMLMEEMRKINYKLAVESSKEITVSVGDEILYNLFKQGCSKTAHTGKCTIDESFMTEFTGHVESYDVYAVPTQLLYELRHRNVEAEMREVDLGQFRVVVPPNQAAGTNSGTDIQFYGDTTVGSVISNVEHAEINQTMHLGRNAASATGPCPGGTPAIQISNAVSNTAGATGTNPGLTMTSGRHGASHHTQIKFHGKTKIGNMISGAKNVKLTQTIHHENAAENNNQPGHPAAMAENDLQQPVQVPVGEEDICHGQQQNEEELPDQILLRGRTFSEPDEDPR